MKILQNHINSEYISIKEKYANIENEYINLRKNFYTILHKNQSIDNLSNKTLLLSLNDWIELISDSVNNTKMDIIMKQCDNISRDLAHKLLSTSNGDVSQIIFKYNQNKYENKINDLTLKINKSIDWIEFKTEWIKVCNDLEEECEKLNDDISHNQSVLEEIRIETQERSDKLFENLNKIKEENKLLLAQKNDLTKQLHSKLRKL